MNRNALYLAVFGVLCVLAGVLVGASITKKANLPWHGPERQSFAKRAERFMWPKLREGRERRCPDGFYEMFTARLELTQEQQIKVKEILEKTRQEIDEVGKNIRSAITEIKEKSNKQIMDILTPQQQEKFKALLKDLERKWRPGEPGEKHRPMREYEK